MLHPLIIKNRGVDRGLYVEADYASLKKNEISSFEFAVQKLGNFISDGEELTGAQFVSRAKSIGCDELSLQVIKKAMLVDEFVDDYVLINAFGIPLFRGTESNCTDMADSLFGIFSKSEYEMKIVRDVESDVVLEAMLAMARREALGEGVAKIVNYRYKPAPEEWVFHNHFFNVPEGYSVCVDRIEGISSPCFDPRVFVRALGILNHEVTTPGALEFSQQDVDANLYLLAMLKKNLGFSFLQSELAGVMSIGNSKSHDWRDHKDEIVYVLNGLSEAESEAHIFRKRPTIGGNQVEKQIRLSPAFLNAFSQNNPHACIDRSSYRMTARG